MSTSTLRPLDIALIISSLAAGLALEVHTGFAGQTFISAAIWGQLLYLLTRVSAGERRAFMACLVIATLGEIFLSLVWGLYTYRLDNIPLFVPPGHVLMLMLGIAFGQRMSTSTADLILGCAAAYALVAAATGIDTLALPLLIALAGISFLLPAQRPLYASTFILALILELYGTWLGNWTWVRQVPVIDLVTTNPPGIASAFYAVLDALVAVTALLLARSLKEKRAYNSRPEPAAAGMHDR